MPQPDYCGLWRAHGIELVDLRRIDRVSYHEARQALYGSTDVDVLSGWVRWLEAQPEWTEAEFLMPDFVLEEIRDQEAIERESEQWQLSQQQQAAAPNTCTPPTSSARSAST